MVLDLFVGSLVVPVIRMMVPSVEKMPISTPRIIQHAPGTTFVDSLSRKDVRIVTNIRVPKMMDVLVDSMLTYMPRNHKVVVLAGQWDVEGLELNGALCYPPCRGQYQGVGPVCWARCPSAASVNCGAICASSSDVCASTIVKLTEDAFELAGIILEGVINSDYVNMVVKTVNLTLTVADMIINKMGWCDTI